jgi:uncharacterized damage-inducible protein DinB
MPATTNPILDRLMRHMAWANQSVLTALESIPAESFALHAAADTEGTVGEVTAHLVRSGGFYSFRVGAEIDLIDTQQANPQNIAALKSSCATADAVLREEAQKPEDICHYRRTDGTEVTHYRSTILAQAIHHATEHRAQIADILTEHGIRVINLDDLDLWAFGQFEAETQGTPSIPTKE